MDNGNIITWNFPNFISFVLMIAILWVVLGAAGHVLWRKNKGQSSGALPATKTVMSPDAVASAAAT